jgi:hypothetical protein
MVPPSAANKPSSRQQLKHCSASADLSTSPTKHPKSLRSNTSRCDRAIGQHLGAVLETQLSNFVTAVQCIVCLLVSQEYVVYVFFTANVACPAVPYEVHV